MAPQEDQMSTTTQTPTTTPTPAPADKPKGHSFSVVLRGEDDAALRIIAIIKATGSAVTYVQHTVKGTDGKNRNTRGATQQHATEAAARKAVEAIAVEAAKLGWVRSQRRSGFVARPDSFSANALPAPKAAKATSKKAR